MERQEAINKILNSYESYFDIIKSPNFPPRLVARCDFHIHNEKYVLVKNAKLWEADCHEYIYVFSVDRLTEEAFSQCEAYACNEGFSLVEPKYGHMYTYITAVFVCDDFDMEAIKLLKKSKHSKSYKFSIYGWAEFRTFVVRAGDMALYYNKPGKQCSKFVKKLK